MGHITVIARVARDLWQRKQTLSLGFALELGSFTAIDLLFSHLLNLHAGGRSLYSLFLINECYIIKSTAPWPLKVGMSLLGS